MLGNVLVEVGRLECQEVPRPKPGPGEIVLQVKAALTCGTDLKAFLRGHPKMPPPTLFGHEFCGVVAETGEGVDAFAVGDEVMSAHTAPCNRCDYCKRDLQNLCPTLMKEMVLGAYAEFIRLPANIVQQNVYIKPKHVPFEHGALLEPLSCVVYGFDQMPAQKNDRVVIMGPGPIGLMYAMLAKQAGAEHVIVVGRRKFRLDTALAIGADQVIDSNNEDIQDAILAATDGLGADIVYECTGIPEVWQDTIKYVRNGGGVLLYGGCKPGTTATWDTYKLHYGQVTLKGAFHFNPKAVRRAYDLICSGELPLEKLITEQYPLTQLDKALTACQSGNCIKAAIIP